MKSFDIMWHDDTIIVENRRYKAGEIMTTYLNVNIEKLDALIASCASANKMDIFALTDKLVSKLPPYNRSSASNDRTDEKVYTDALASLKFCRDEASMLFDMLDDGRDISAAWSEAIGSGADDVGSLCTSVCVADGAVCCVCKGAGLKEFINIAFLQSVRSGVRPRRCGCCGKYFLPNNPIAKFCDRKAPNAGGKTCREVGARKRYGQKAKSDPVITIYNRCYKTRYARVTNGKMTRAQLNDWKAAASLLRDKAASGVLTVEEFEARMAKL